MFIIKEGIMKCNSLILLRAVAKLYLLLILHQDEATAQPTGNTDTFRLYSSFDPSMSILVVVLVCVLFLIGFFSIYIRQCADSQPASSAAHYSSGHGENNRSGVLHGLDQTVIESFPVFAYSSVRDVKIGEGVLECAVCLSEFEDDETLRLLPKCNHVFHSDCIDAWLAYHVTCPVCRADLHLAGVDCVGHVTTIATETIPPQSPDDSNLDSNDEEGGEPAVMNNHFTNQAVFNINNDQIRKEAEPNHKVTTTARETLPQQSPDSNDKESREPTVIMNNHFTNQVVFNINDDQISEEDEPNHDVTTTAMETLPQQSQDSNLDSNAEESIEPTVIMNNHFTNQVVINIIDDQIRKEAEPNHDVTTTARETLPKQSPDSNDEESREPTVIMNNHFTNQVVFNINDDQIRKEAEPNHEVTTKENVCAEHVTITARETLQQQSPHSIHDSNDEKNRGTTIVSNQFMNQVVININDDQIR